MGTQKMLDEIKCIVNSDNTVKNKLQEICDFLKSGIDIFDWVGFYIVSNEDNQLLKLEAYAGEPTEHREIHFGKGICGQAASLKKTFIVQDISKEKNYLSCSPEVKSEIVIPIFKGDSIIGELDIDSHKKDAIKKHHVQLCEQIAHSVSLLF